MKPSRCWFQYSLRSFLILLTALAVWLGVVVRRATEQREAVKAIEALGGAVIYDWMLVKDSKEMSFRPSDEQRPSGPDQLRSLLGNDFFQHVQCGEFPWGDEDAVRAIPEFQRLWGLKSVLIPPTISAATLDKIKAGLSHCKIIKGHR